MPITYDTRAGYALRTCPECDTAFPPLRHDQVFCSAPCNNKHRNREMLRGKQLYRLAYHCIQQRGKLEGHGLGDLGRMVREWIAEDKAEGRNPPPPANLNR